MLDIKLIRENTDDAKARLTSKGVKAEAIDQLLALDSSRRELLSAVELLRGEQKKLDYQSESDRSRANQLKAELNTKEAEYNTVDGQFIELLLTIPNLADPSVPVGEGESANRPIRSSGEKPNLSNPKDHVELGALHDLFDTERAAKVSGARFNFLKNQAVLLEFALIRLAMDMATEAGFTPMTVPQLVNAKTVTGTGYLPQGADEVYKTDDDLYLIGTSELALVAYHSDEILDLSQLPIRYVGFSTCFRKEAGSYGKDTKGILRQHQFDKVELVSLVKPHQSEAELQMILAFEEKLMQALELPYQVLEIGTGDLGIQAAKKYDIEAWLPGQDKYRETHSCSNTTDYQSRRLNIRYKAEDGTNQFVHALNGTAVAIGRMLIALLENGQQADGTIKIPVALAKYCGFDVID